MFYWRRQTELSGRADASLAQTGDECSRLGAVSDGITRHLPEKKPMTITFKFNLASRRHHDFHSRPTTSVHIHNPALPFSQHPHPLHFSFSSLLGALYNFFFKFSPLSTIPDPHYATLAHNTRTSSNINTIQIYSAIVRVGSNKVVLHDLFTAHAQFQQALPL